MWPWVHWVVDPLIVSVSMVKHSPLAPLLVVVVSQKAVRLVMFSSTAVFLLVIPELYSLASNGGAVDFMLVIAWLTGSFDQ